MRRFYATRVDLRACVIALLFSLSLSLPYPRRCSVERESEAPCSFLLRSKGRSCLSKKGVGKGSFVPYLLRVKPAHIYRRRRIGAAFLVALVSGALYVGPDADAEQRPISYTVAPGDTLWSIATDRYPASEDPRLAIEAIRRANEIKDHQIHPGQRLELPPARA